MHDFNNSIAADILNISDTSNILYAYIDGVRVNTEIVLGNYTIRPIEFSTIQPMDTDWIHQSVYNSCQRVFITTQLSDYSMIMSTDNVLDDYKRKQNDTLKNIINEIDDLYNIIAASTGLISCPPSYGIVYIKCANSHQRKIGEVGRTRLINRNDGIVFDLSQFAKQIEENYNFYRSFKKLNNDRDVLFLMRFFNECCAFFDSSTIVDEQTYDILPLLTTIEVFLECKNKTKIIGEIIENSEHLLINKNYLLHTYSHDDIKKLVKQYYEYRSALLHGRKSKVSGKDAWIAVKDYICDLTIASYRGSGI